MNVTRLWSISVAIFATFTAFSPVSAQLVRSAAGPSVASVAPVVDSFRLDLGGGTVSGLNGSFGGLRREINWDGVPDDFSAPNALPANFFNVNSPRGVVFATPGSGFQLSADSSNPTSTATQFGNIDPNYPVFFEPFSAERLFTAVGSNIVDVSFFVPGTSTPAFSRGFGAVFSDVDLANTTSLQFFDAANTSLGTFFVPNVAAMNETFSFLGVSFGTPLISKVRITSGNQLLAPGNIQTDVVVMDDFIFAEPVAAVPETGNNLLLLTLALLALFVAHRSMQRAGRPLGS